jgi:WD40 repeat protein
VPTRLVSLDHGPDIVLDRPSLVVGRHPACDVCIDSLCVSRHHCRLTLEDGRVTVRDLGSTNGIRINGERVEAGSLQPGDGLAIAHFCYRLVDSRDQRWYEPPGRGQPAGRPGYVSDLLAAHSRALSSWETTRLIRAEAEALRRRFYPHGPLTPAAGPDWLVVVVAVVLILAAIGGWALWSSRGAPKAVLRGNGDTWPLAFTPDGTGFATAGDLGVTLWDTATGRTRALWAQPAGSHSGMGTFSTDGNTLATIDFFGPGSPMAVTLRDAGDGRVRWTLPVRNEGAYAILFTAAGQHVRAIVGVRNSDSGEVVDVDAASGRELSRKSFTLVSRTGGSSVSPDGRLMAFLSGTAVILWNLETDREHAAPVAASAGTTVSSTGFSSDGSTLAIGLSDGSIVIWDLPALQHRATLRCHKAGVRSVGLQLSGNAGIVASRGHFSGADSLVGAILDAVARAVATGAAAREEVVVLDAVTGERIGAVSSALHPFLSPNARTLAVRNRSFAVELFDLPCRFPSAIQPAAQRHPRSP